ncbi:ester cyclase [Terribacillus saccharophilus]|uniref:ester cyclase n=1 Tax=Terribacillus saccharophilus TaxID=361277 RepID=UPI0020D029A7|nr:ester cyclase [Terribacillus saccharophilus]
MEQENYDALNDYCHEEFVFYPQLDTPFPGVEGLIESEKKNFDAFPGFKMPILSITAEENRVAVYFLFEGKHTGIPFAGVPATGKHARFSLMILLKIKNGKIVEQRSHVDVHDIIRQIN